jgi:hypothetical protein
MRGEKYIPPQTLGLDSNEGSSRLERYTAMLAMLAAIMMEFSSAHAEAKGATNKEEQPYNAEQHQVDKMLAWDAMARDSTDVAAHIEYVMSLLEQDQRENGTATEATVLKAVAVAEMAKGKVKDEKQREKLEQVRKMIIDWHLKDASKVVQDSFKETMWNEEIKRMRKQLDEELGRDRERMAGGEPGIGERLKKAAGKNRPIEPGDFRIAQNKHSKHTGLGHKKFPGSYNRGGGRRYNRTESQ